MSSARRERSRRKRSIRSLRSTASPPRPRSTSTAARSAASRARPSLPAATTILARRGGSGRARSCRPISVNAAVAIERAEIREAARALRSRPLAAADRGRRRVAGSVTPQAAQSRRSDDRSAERISGRPIRLQRPVRRLVPQPVAHARLGAAGAAAALVGGGPRHAHGLEPRQADVGLVARHARQPAIDHHAHALDGQRGLGDGGGEHDLAPARRRRRRRRGPARRGRALHRAARGRRPGRRCARAAAARRGGSRPGRAGTRAASRALRGAPAATASATCSSMRRSGSRPR